jgi:N-acetylmuramoyl-L-alanine amidase
MIITAVLLSCLPLGTIQAASGIKLYNYSTKKTTTYTGKQVKVLYNGNQVSVNSTPGIIVDGIALVSYKEIFVNSGIDVEFTYNNAKGTLILTKDNTTISMTINSRSAKVNGKSVTLPVAPQKIKYVNANTTKVLVPSRFISETFGLKYTWYSNRNTVEIEKNSLRLSYNGGQKFEYTGTKGSVTVEGTKVELGTMPSIILNDTAMLRAKKVFADSIIGADYKYDKATKTVSLTKNGNELTMTIGSKNAYLNKKPFTLQQGPIIIQNYENNTSYVMVPGSVTANSLGYDYSWSNSICTSIIMPKKSVTQPEDGNTNPGTNPPVQGGDGSENDQEKVLQQWQADANQLGLSSGVHELNADMIPTGAKGFIYSVSRDYTDVRLNTETFLITSSVPFERVTSGMSEQMITIQASSMESWDQTYPMLGVSSNIINTISTAYNPMESNTTVSLQVIPDNLSYDIHLSEDRLNLYITLYQNALTSAVIGTNTSGDFLTLTGVDKSKVVISEQDGYLFLDLPYIKNALGEVFADIASTKVVNQLYTFGFTDKTRLMLKMTDGYEYKVSDSDQQYTINFSRTNAPSQPDTPTSPGNPTQPNTPAQPEWPTDIDSSKCEIIIPMPSGITDKMILHEDYYFKNQFAIKITGDHRAFYENYPVTTNSKVITKVSVSLNANNQTELLFTTSKLQGYEFTTNNNNIYVNIGNPRDIYKNIIVLDPGHGGPANGAEYFGTKEKNNNLKILYTLGEKYFNSNPWELKVYYTRTTDVDMSLQDRAAFASKVGADLFVSLHMNASTASSARGTEVYYSGSNEAKMNGLTSKTLATIMVDNLTKTLGTSNRGAKSEKYTVVYRNTVPAILIELGFLSNKNDHALITDPAFQEKAVKEIYDTILGVFKKYPTGR